MGMKRQWIKLYLEILDDDKFGMLPEYMKWRAIELFLVAGENGDDGLLPPIERLAWRLRLDKTKIAETLSALTQVGVVNETPRGWMVTNFKKRQYSESYERVKHFREQNKERYSNVTSNANVTAEESSSTSYSDSNSLIDSAEIPNSPAEAARQVDIIVFHETTGRIPGISQYKTVIDTIRFLRDKRSLTYETAITYLTPYWLAWSSRKRIDGKPYDPSNLTWLTEWAINGSIPTQKAQTAENELPSMYDAQEAKRRKAWETIQELERSNAN